MSALPILSYEDASAATQEIFDGLKQKIGKVPNIYASVGHSPTALKAVLGYGEQLKAGGLSPAEVEVIALVCAQQNDCQYCLAAHTAIGKMAGMSDEQTVSARKVALEDPKLQALAVLVKSLVATQGRPEAAVVDAFYAAGYDRSALVDVIGFVSLNMFTNYFNNIAETEVDFPAPPSL